MTTSDIKSTKSAAPFLFDAASILGLVCQDCAELTKEQYSALSEMSDRLFVLAETFDPKLSLRATR